MTGSSLEILLREKHIKGLIFDLDGVVTRTAEIHAKAWEKLFNEFLKNRGANYHKTYQPFQIETDYPQYVDGIPRGDGIRNFLASRGISLPPGSLEDAPGTETIQGLSNLKNQYYLDLISKEVPVYADAVSWIKERRAAGFLTAIISASKNCRFVLQVTGLEPLFDVRIDGIAAAALHLKGKPAPDIFLEAVRALNLHPGQAAVFEDARFGVQAARAGNFGLVVGINRKGETEKAALLASGADLVISQFPEPLN